MRIKNIPLLLAIIVGNALSADGQITFQKTFGGTAIDYGWSVQQTNDGGYILAGVTFSFGAGSDDIYLIRTDANGDTLWTKTFGGTESDIVISVQQTADGGYIIAGHTTSFSGGDRDVYLIRTDASGNTLWTKTYGGGGDDYGWSVQQTADDGYIVAGYTSSFGAGLNDIYLIKTDANGNTLWAKTFGGADNDYGRSVRQTGDGGYIIAGYTSSFSAGDEDAFLIRTDANGNLLWASNYGEVNGDFGNYVRQTSDGGFIIVGSTWSFGAGGFDVYLIRTDSNGFQLFYPKTLGGTDFDDGWSVQQTNDGGYILTGLTRSFGAGDDDVYLIRTDSNGDTLWTRAFGGGAMDQGYSVQQTSDGGYIIAGTTFSFGAGSVDIYLIKTDANGNSDCNESNTATAVDSPINTVSSGIIPSSSPPNIVNSPATITGAGGSITTLCSNVGIDEVSALLQPIVTIYPNPFSASATLHLHSSLLKEGQSPLERGRGVSFVMYDLLGREVTRSVIPSGARNLTIHRGNLPSGMYFYKLTDKEKSLAAGKIIIQ